MRKPFMVAVLVATHNRASLLRGFLAALARSEGLGEIKLSAYIVDDRSTDTTADVVHAAAQTAPFPIRYINALGRGKSKALNQGLGAVPRTTDFVLFTDDDCVPQPDWVIKAVTALQRDKDIGLVGGRVDIYDRRDFAPGFTTDVAVLTELCSGADYFETTIMGANMAARYAALSDVGGFDTRLGPGTRLGVGAEDFDLVYRIIAHGWRVVFDPSPTILHHHGRRTAKQINRAFAVYDVGAGAILAKFGRSDPEVRRRMWWRIRKAVKQRQFARVAHMFRGLCFRVGP